MSSYGSGGRLGADESTVKPDATPEEVKQVLESENPQIFSQAVSRPFFRGLKVTNSFAQLLNSNRYGDARGALREIQERNQDIKKIEKTLTELAQMFNEVSPLSPSSWSPGLLADDAPSDEHACGAAG